MIGRLRRWLTADFLPIDRRATPWVLGPECRTLFVKDVNPVAEGLHLHDALELRTAIVGRRGAWFDEGLDQFQAPRRTI